MRIKSNEGEFSAHLALVHEAEDRLREAEAVKASRKGRIGKFFATIGVSKAEKTLAHRNLLYDEVLLGPQSRQPEKEILEAPPTPGLM